MLRHAAFTLLAGTAHPALAAAVARALGRPLGACRVQRFPDGEISVEVDESVRGHDVFILQPTAPPVNDNLVELLIFADACRRASAERVTAIVPYFGYARADRRHGHRRAVSASLVALLIQSAGFDRVITVDLHTPQIEGFFHVPVDGLTAVPVLADAVRDRVSAVGGAGAVAVSPDAGRVPMATEYAHRLGLPLVVLHKRRANGTETAVSHLVGDVRDRTCVIIDDMIATGGTLAESIRVLTEAGARHESIVVSTHGLLLDDAYQRLVAAGVRELFVTDSVPTLAAERPAITIVSIAPLLAAAIRHQLADGSMSDLF